YVELHKFFESRTQIDDTHGDRQLTELSAHQALARQLVTLSNVAIFFQGLPDNDPGEELKVWIADVNRAANSTARILTERLDDQLLEIVHEPLSGDGIERLARFFADLCGTDSTILQHDPQLRGDDRHIDVASMQAAKRDLHFAEKAADKTEAAGLLAASGV